MTTDKASRILSTAFSRRDPVCLSTRDLVHRFDLESISLGVPLVRMPFSGPLREDVVAVAIELIARFGLQARDEALYLEEVAAILRSAGHRALYRDVAREIEKSIAEARVRLKASPESEAVKPR